VHVVVIGRIDLPRLCAVSTLVWTLSCVFDVLIRDRAAILSEWNDVLSIAVVKSLKKLPMEIAKASRADALASYGAFRVSGGFVEDQTDASSTRRTASLSTWPLNTHATRQ